MTLLTAHPPFQTLTVIQLWHTEISADGNMQLQQVGQIEKSLFEYFKDNNNHQTWGGKSGTN